VRHARGQVGPKRRSIEQHLFFELRTLIVPRS
jgi:hypothetical protein